MKIGANCGNDETTTSQITSLLTSGKLGAAGVFETPDCRKTYQELSAKGVEFLAPPEDKFYGVEAIFKDPCGNHFSLTQPKKH